MKPNVLALLAEIFYKCEEEESLSVKGTEGRSASASDLTLKAVGNKENVAENRSISAPVLSSGKSGGNSAQKELAEDCESRSWTRASSISGSLDFKAKRQADATPRKAYSETNVSRSSKSSFQSPFQLSFTADIDLDTSEEFLVPNGGLEAEDEKKNPFSGIFQKAVLAGETRKTSAPNQGGVNGSPRLPPKYDQPLLVRRAKQKPRNLAAEDWDMVEEDVEGLRFWICISTCDDTHPPPRRHTHTHARTHATPRKRARDDGNVGKTIRANPH